MRILLIGGTGFVGEHLAKRLSARKNCEVIVVGINSVSKKADSNRLCYVKLDLTKLSKKLEKLVNSAEVAVILTQPNKRIIENFISAIKPRSHLKKIVYLSSVLIYDNFNGKQNEKFPVNPLTDYERGKHEEEAMLSKFVQGQGSKLCIARLANVYGDVKNRGLINHILLSILNNGKLTINGKGDSVRDYIFVEDAAAWLDFLIFWNQKNKKEIVNVCTGRGYGVKEVIQMIEKTVGKKVTKIYGPAVQEKRKIIGDNKKIVNLSEIKLKFNLIKGLKQTYKNYSQ